MTRHSPLEAGEVHVWWVDLNMSESCLDQLEGTLSADEVERARRFRFEHHRQRFIASRGMLRRLLSRYLAEAPDQIRFQYGPQGKPALAGSSPPNLCFNLSHSHELALYAFSSWMHLGIDVEYIHPVKDALKLIQRYFSPGEVRVYRSLTQPEEKQLAFYMGWTRKEAFLKATGEGLAIALDQVEVTIDPRETAQFLSLPTSFQPVAGWQLLDLKPHPAYCGALAVNGAARQVIYRRWAEESVGLPIKVSLEGDPCGWITSPR